MLEATSITDVSITLPSLTEIIKVLTLRTGLNSTLVVLGTTFLGISAGIVGSFTLLRKRALMSDCLAHATLPGLCLAFMFCLWLGYSNKSLPALLVGAGLSALVAMLCVQVLSKQTLLKEDTCIGAVLSVFFGIGITLLSYIQGLDTGSVGGLQHFIYGQTAAMNYQDALLTCILAIVATVCAFIFLKEFRLVCFDAEFARAQGWPTNVIDSLMMLLTVLVTVIGLQSVGLILVVAMLVIPATSARFWTENLSKMILISALLGGLSGYIGASASSLLPRMPAGSVIVIVSGFLFTISFLLAPNRGLISSSYRLLRLRFKIAKEHLLRGIYESIEKSGKPAASFRTNDIQHTNQMAYVWVACFLYLLRWQKLVVNQNSNYSLTAQGLNEARRLTRNHRLWEEYLLSQTGIDVNHVDFSADRVEHFLSAEIIQALESRLAIKKDIESKHPL